MGRKVDALNAIAVEQGHTGDEPTSVIGAINAIIKAMGGDGEAASIADAITALAPYIGGCGGGLGPLVPAPVIYKAHKPYVGEPYADRTFENMVYMSILVGDTPIIENGMLQTNKPKPGQPLSRQTL